MMSSPNTRMRDRIQKQPKYRAGACKLLVVFAIAISFVAFSILRDSWAPQQDVLYTRSIGPPAHALADEEDLCYLVHQARDKCAWVRKNCPTEEGGFTTILEIYYCRFPRLKALALPGICLWLAFLFTAIGITASDFFCVDLSTIASLLGMSESLAGVTLLALGNGSPDVFSTFAAMGTNSGSLAIGELFGAAGFISSVVAGSMALVRPFHVSKKSFIRDVGFFAGAAAFSMVFLWDGRLHLWECIFMVIYYCFYVAFVSAWHWYLDRRRKLRAKEAAARGHFVPPEYEDEANTEPYRDDPTATNEAHRPGFARSVSREDWSALENQGGDDEYDNGDEDVEEQARDRWMSELASNMRVARPNARTRKNTMATPVRPSLVGALEFQSVLKSLQKSRNIQTIPLHSRRYSDDPTFTTLQLQDQLSEPSDPATRPPYQVNVTDDASPSLERTGGTLVAPQGFLGGRTRAVSAVDTAALRLHSGMPRLSPIQSEDYLIETFDDDTHSRSSRERSRSHLDVPNSGIVAHQLSPSLRIEPPSPQRLSPLSEVRSVTSEHATTDYLAPPGPESPNRLVSDYITSGSGSSRGGSSPRESPRAVPRADRLPQIVIPPRSRSRSSSRATSPFPAYRDHISPSITASTRSPMSTRAPSLYLPPAMASPESLSAEQTIESETPRRPTKLTRIWPYSVLPPPGVIASTLFPAFCDWKDKGWFARLLAVACAPSVLLLTLSLPVVESEQNMKDSSPPTPPAKSMSWESARSKSANGVPTIVTSLSKDQAPSYFDTPSEVQQYDVDVDGVAGIGNVGTAAVESEQNHTATNQRTSRPPGPHMYEPVWAIDNTDGEGEPWNRWLTILQLFLAPIVIVFACWLQAPSESSPIWLLKPVLISLLVSTVLLVPFLLTTTSTHRPRIYRILLSLVGFAVAVAWISAIASQVVGALKALAVICNISHAIMGLTIFAMGNSLGDLVADLTVARLGYPVMALSACFGGPMLNILLGIGLAGSYNLVKGAEKRQHKHPGKGLKFKPVHIEVSQTLIVSGITLLVTLIGLLIAVPLNKWVFDRKIAWALIVVWAVSTTANVCIEVFGLQWGRS